MPTEFDDPTYPSQRKVTRDEKGTTTIAPQYAEPTNEPLDNNWGHVRDVTLDEYEALKSKETRKLSREPISLRPTSVGVEMRDERGDPRLEPTIKSARSYPSPHELRQSARDQASGLASNALDSVIDTLEYLALSDPDLVERYEKQSLRDILSQLTEDCEKRAREQ